MVKTVLEELGRAFPSAGASESPYAVRGNHISLESTRENVVAIAEFFRKKGFYINDLTCVDFIEYLEIVYFFNTYESPCRVKMTLKLEPERPSAPTISHIYRMAHWYEREVHEFFGVFFENHANMAYLFLHEGLDFYPLRKNRIAVTAGDRALLNSFAPSEEDDSFFVNFGPQHPSTHGGLRLVMKLDGEYTS
jgi:NADH:ubiquinone oxidoreductase subunit C